MFLLGYRPQDKEHPRYAYSPEMREAMRRLDRYIKMSNLICKYDFKTDRDINNFIDNAKEKLQKLEHQRQKIYNLLRRCKDPSKIDELKALRDKLPFEITSIRKEIKVGCEIIRVACLDVEDAKAIKAIKEQINIPIVADIHFDYKIALAAIEAGVDKIRINPGNIGDEEKTRAVVEACRENKIPIRIGVNLGSLNKGVTAKGATYLSFVIQDKTGNMDAKYWSPTADEVAVLKPGMVVELDGEVRGRTLTLRHVTTLIRHLHRSTLLRAAAENNAQNNNQTGKTKTGNQLNEG